MNSAKTVCAWALARFLHSCPKKLDIGSSLSWTAIFLSASPEIRKVDTASHERVVGAWDLAGQPIFSVQGTITQIWIHVRTVATTSLPSPLAVTMRGGIQGARYPSSFEFSFLLATKKSLRNGLEVCLIIGSLRKTLVVHLLVSKRCGMCSTENSSESKPWYKRKFFFFFSNLCSGFEKTHHKCFSIFCIKVSFERGDAAYVWCFWCL